MQEIFKLKIFQNYKPKYCYNNACPYFIVIYFHRLKTVFSDAREIIDSVPVFALLSKNYKSHRFFSPVVPIAYRKDIIAIRHLFCVDRRDYHTLSLRAIPTTTCWESSRDPYIYIAARTLYIRQRKRITNANILYIRRRVYARA